MHSKIRPHPDSDCNSQQQTLHKERPHSCFLDIAGTCSYPLCELEVMKNVSWARLGGAARPSPGHSSPYSFSAAWGSPPVVTIQFVWESSLPSRRLLQFADIYHFPMDLLAMCANLRELLMSGVSTTKYESRGSSTGVDFKPASTCQMEKDNLGNTRHEIICGSSCSYQRSHFENLTGRRSRRMGGDEKRSAIIGCLCIYWR